MDPRYIDLARGAHELVDRSFVQKLKAKRPTAVVAATASIWLQLVLCWAIALLGPIWLVPLSFVMACAIVQAMLLWVHEASHFSLVDDRRFNDIWCDLFFAGPIGISVAAYRFKHASHHAELGTANDLDGYPYHLNVRGTRSLFLVMLRSLCGLTGVWLIRSKYAGDALIADRYPRVSPRWVAPSMTLGLNLGLLALSISAGRWYLYFLIWVYPIVGMAIVLNIVRSVAEHQPEDFSVSRNGRVSGMRPVARTTVPNWFEKWLMYQANFNFHVEHHVFPTVPRHNLRKLHLHLVEKGFYQQFPDALQRSGLRTFWRLSRNKISNDFTEAVSDAVHS